MLLPIQSQIPLTIRDFLSDFAAEVLATALFAILAFLFLRRRSRTASWDERRAQVSEDIRTRLYRMIQAQEPLSAHEERDDPAEPGLTKAERDRLLRQSGQAYEELQAIYREHRYRLAPRVIEIIDHFFRQLRDEDVMDITYPQAVILALTNNAHRDLVEFLPADIGRDRGVH